MINVIEERKSVFISYSWEDLLHQEWVQHLANKLRTDYGIDATIDKFETHKGTTHLPRMMTENINKSDYIVIVLSKGYTKRADNFEGGVGFENELLLPLLQENKDKIIFIKHDDAEFNEVLPFHFKGYYTIDFSNEINFEEKLEELAYRIYGVPLYEKSPLGDIPDLKPKKSTGSKDTFDAEFEDSIAELNKPITDLDKNKFLKESFLEIVRLFKELFDQIESKNSNFDYELENITTYKCIFTIYQNGNEKTGMKIWLSNSMMRGINFLYGKRLDSHNDNSLNETLVCEVGENQQLRLKMTMNMFNSSTPGKLKEIVELIWKQHLKNRLT